MQQKSKSTKNRREKTVGFIYVFLLVFITTAACCTCLFYYSANKTGTRKELVIDKMDRIRDFQHVQEEQMVVAEAMFEKITEYNPGIYASYEENDIKFYLNNMRKLYEDNRYDKRYQIFQQTSDFYTMWFADKKELWSKRQNINQFTKNLEDCQIGLQKKMDDINNTNK